MRRTNLWTLSFLLLAPMFASAGTLSCGNAGAYHYCQYDGRVSRAYVNAYDQIIVYFDTDFASSIPAQAGFTVTSAASAIVPMLPKPEFAKMFYASLLSAQAQGKTVTLQMYEVNTNQGLLQADRIWVNDY